MVALGGVWVYMGCIGCVYFRRGSIYISSDIDSTRIMGTGELYSHEGTVYLLIKTKGSNTAKRREEYNFKGVCFLSYTPCLGSSQAGIPQRHEQL